jgi:serine/threonine-protein kinase
MTLEAGRTIEQKIRLVRVLGKGGMGSVWVADHLGLRTQVAVKFMSAEIADNAEARGRFVREATAAAQIKSPHVVQVFDHGVTEDGFPFIVMELLEGEDLGKRIERLGALSPRDAVEIVAQTCKALGRAHAQGIVHRDIKPENVFLVDTDDDDLFVKVLDFGIAKRFGDGGMNMTSTGAMVGTPYYMSPEQIMSARDVDPRSDLWSVAVVTYHALTGALPFVAETVGALCVKINSALFEPPSRSRPELAALDAWFARALAREPAHRFASAKELAEALRQATGTLPARPSIEMPPETTAFAPRAESSGSWQSTEALSVTPALSVPRTLMEATISAHTPKSSSLPVLGLLLGVLALVGVAAVGIGIWWKLRADPTVAADPAAAATDAPAAALPPESSAPSTPSAEPEPKPQPSQAARDEPGTQRAEPKRADTQPTDAKPAGTKPTQQPVATQPPAKPVAKPVETKPAEKDYGF